MEELIEAGIHWMHLDVMDGHFVPNLTIGPPVVKSLQQIKNVYLDCHLMIEEPEKYIEAFIKAGAHNITLHIESKGAMDSMLKRIKQAGVGCGLTLKPATPLKAIEPYLELVDLVLVMTVNPGFGGQSFMEDQVPKIEELARIRKEQNHPYKIQVDGGVNDKSLHHLHQADILVAGSYIFNHPEGYQRAIQNLQRKKQEVL